MNAATDPVFAVACVTGILALGSRLSCRDGSLSEFGTCPIKAHEALEQLAVSFRLRRERKMVADSLSAAVAEIAPLAAVVE